MRAAAACRFSLWSRCSSFACSLSCARLGRSGRDLDMNAPFVKSPLSAMRAERSVMALLPTHRWDSVPLRGPEAAYPLRPSCRWWVETVNDFLLLVIGYWIGRKRPAPITNYLSPTTYGRSPLSIESRLALNSVPGFHSGQRSVRAT